MLAVLLLGMGAAGLPRRGGAEEAKAEKIEELYQLVGLEGRLAPLAVRASAELRARAGGAPGLPAAERAVAAAFAPERLFRDVVQRSVALSDSEATASALAWWHSPLGRKLTDLTLQASKPEAVAQVQSYGQQLAKRPVTAERRKLAERLETALDSTSASLDRTQAVSLAVEVATNALLPPAQRSELSALRRRISGERQGLRGQRRHVTLLYIYYAFRDVPDADLAKYVEFAESPAGRASSETEHKAVRGALDAAAEGLAEGVAAELQKDSEASGPA